MDVPDYFTVPHRERVRETMLWAFWSTVLLPLDLWTLECFYDRLRKDFYYLNFFLLLLFVFPVVYFNMNEKHYSDSPIHERATLLATVVKIKKISLQLMLLRPKQQKNF